MELLIIIVRILGFLALSYSGFQIRFRYRFDFIRGFDLTPGQIRQPYKFAKLTGNLAFFLGLVLFIVPFIVEYFYPNFDQPMVYFGVGVVGVIYVSFKAEKYL